MKPQLLLKLMPHKNLSGKEVTWLDSNTAAPVPAAENKWPDETEDDERKSVEVDTVTLPPTVVSPIVSPISVSVKDERPPIM